MSKLPQFHMKGETIFSRNRDFQPTTSLQGFVRGLPATSASTTRMSNKPVLYYAPRSPPSRAVLLTAAEIGVELDLRWINVKNGENKTPEFLKLNPQHTIPVLDDNGIVITDSHVICTYLADKYSKNENLYPKELVSRNKVLARLFFNCGHLLARVQSAVQPVFYLGYPDVPQDKIEYIQSAYDGLEYCLTGSSYIAGDNMTIADLCSIASVSTAHDIAPIDQKKFPNVWAWVERMRILPYYNKWNREGADTFKNFLAQKLEENKQSDMAK